jgi:hypothetical protein
VTGKGIRVPHVVRGIVDDVDVGKSDNADNEQAKRHGEQSLKNDARFRADEERQVSGIRLSQIHLP